MSESTQVKLAALGVLALLGGLVAVAIAAKPAPLESTQDLAVVTLAPPVAVATAAAPSPTLLPTVGPVVILPPDRTPVETERGRVFGEDGIFGLPGWPWRADDNAASGLAWLKGGRAYTSSR